MGQKTFFRSLPDYLINESGIKEDTHKKLLHDEMIKSNDGSSPLSDQSEIAKVLNESTFKFRIDQLINDSKFYLSLV